MKMNFLVRCTQRILPVVPGDLKTSIFCHRCLRLLSSKGSSSGHQIDSYSKREPKAGEYKNPINLIRKEMQNVKKYGIKSVEHMPRETDVLIVGGGAIGLAAAYALQSRNPQGYSIVVVERDTTYSQAASALSVGGIRQQFSLKENIEMSLHGAEFMRNLPHNLSVLGVDAPDIQFNPQGYLFLASPSGVDTLKQNHHTQTELKAQVDIMNPDKLAVKFPWLNVSDLELGSYGLANEGWFDPWLYLAALKSKCASLGVKFVNAEVTGFEYEGGSQRTVLINGIPTRHKVLESAVVTEDGEKEHSIKFAMCINAAGPWAGEVAKLAGIGSETNGPLSVPLPVEPRKRYVFMFHCPEGPGFDMPMLIDPSGVYCRREGVGGHYICGVSPSEDEDEPDPSNMDVDYTYFESKLWPALAHRVPAFECLKEQDPESTHSQFFHEHIYPILCYRVPIFKNLQLKSAWAGLYDFNSFDQNLIIGNHPYHRNFFFANGSSGHGIQHAAAIGRALSELILDDEYKTIDLSRFAFDRVMYEEPIYEHNIV